MQLTGWGCGGARKIIRWFELSLPAADAQALANWNHMVSLLKIVLKSPIPSRLKLDWTRTLLMRKYASDIRQARESGNKEKERELNDLLRLEMELHQEDEDKYITTILLRQARKLRVPVPHRKHELGEESEHWYYGDYTSGWYLTNSGISALRKKVRSEIKDRHEARSRWVIWISALTGVIGAATGLLAVLSKLIS